MLARPPEDVRRRIEELIKRCGEMSSESSDAQGGAERALRIPLAEMWRFLISSIQAVKSACGRKSPHLRELERCRELFAAREPLSLDTCRGVLEAARDDLNAGMLDDLRQLVAAEVFGDLLESAEYLLKEGHHLPAVALAGATLESTLRGLAAKNGVQPPKKGKPWSGISELNTALYTANLYGKVKHGEIDAWAKLRNAVDHGNFMRPEDIDSGAAQRMVGGVREFTLRSHEFTLAADLVR
jgi:hypothetical protein